MNWLMASIIAAGMLPADPAPPSPEAVMAVPDELAAQAHEAVVAATPSKAERLDKLVDFLHSGHGLDFGYRAKPTRSVAGTYTEGEGNCLAFTLTFIALARQAGLTAYPREVNVRAQWRREGSAVLSIGHVNVGVDTTNRNAIVDFEPDLMEAQRLAHPFRGRRISDERALAHFYNNRAAELMVEGRLAAARAWVDHALAMDATFAPAWITSGVVSRRSGETARAERDFLTALDLEERSVNALVNLVTLERETGDREAMIHYGRRLEELAPDDPYFLWELGRLHRDLGEPGLARRSFERAVRLSRGEDPTLLAALAEVLLEQGEREDARRYLTQSMALMPVEGPVDDLERLLRLKKRL